MRTKRAMCFLLVFPIIAGCASVPSGPNVMALPGTGRSFQEFRADDAMCRDFAFQQIGGGAREQAANAAGLSHAAVGTVIGAAAGAAIGGQRAAGAGAGMGLVVGSATGADASRSLAYGGQRHYDMAYVQCMYAQGHRVPVSASYSSMSAPTTVPPQKSTGQLPPPPPAGTPPPPPH